MDNKQKKEKHTNIIRNKEEYSKIKKNELVDILIDKDNELQEKEAKLEKYKKALINMQENEKKMINFFCGFISWRLTFHSLCMMSLKKCIKKWTFPRELRQIS